MQHHDEPDPHGGAASGRPRPASWVPNPWIELAKTDLVLLTLDIPERGRYYHRQRAIVLRDGLLVCEQRAVLWHELEHARRGDTACAGLPDGGVLDARQEQIVHRDAARRAIPYEALLAAGRWAHTWAEIADAVKVDVDLVRTRYRTMHPAERAMLLKELDDRLERIA